MFLQSVHGHVICVRRAIFVDSYVWTELQIMLLFFCRQVSKKWYFRQTCFCAKRAYSSRSSNGTCLLGFVKLEKMDVMCFSLAFSYGEELYLGIIIRMWYFYIQLHRRM